MSARGRAVWQLAWLDCNQFDDGRVILDRYELGAKAKAAGALSLESLTPAMADAKLRMAIAMHRDKPERIQMLLSTDIVGELLGGFEDVA